MIRKLITNFLETSITQTHPETIIYPSTITLNKELSNFSWLTTIAPCFSVNSKNINILSEPHEFYQILKESCKNAQNYITIASLYLGNGNLEKNLINIIKNNERFLNNKLKLRILIDYTRGSRYHNNSRILLQPLLNLSKNNNNCEISLYHTPVLRGLFKKFVPDRWNELFGLQHMKLYIFDDILVISGANLSNDYFTNRQDRYYVIKDKKLCDFYNGLVIKVQKFSLQMNYLNQIELSNNWNLLPYKSNQNNFIKKAGDLVDSYILEQINEQNYHRKEGCDTWIFPLIQMGQLGINQDSQTVDRILAEAPKNSTLYIASGYFNLTNQYINTLIKNCQAQCKILMAHPKANGFFDAKGPAGGIPLAYSLIAQKFWQKIQQYHQQNRILLYEYLRNNWTYHVKGLWYYPNSNNDNNKNNLPCLTLIGSPNFGERSVNKDLETQLAIITDNIELKEKIDKECKRLFEFALTAETKRKIPIWIYAFVTIFQKYF